MRDHVPGQNKVATVTRRGLKNSSQLVFLSRRWEGMFCSGTSLHHLSMLPPTKSTLCLQPANLEMFVIRAFLENKFRHAEHCCSIVMISGGNESRLGRYPCDSSVATMFVASSRGDRQSRPFVAVTAKTLPPLLFRTACDCHENGNVITYHHPRTRSYARNNSHHPSNLVADRRIADMAILARLWVLPQRRDRHPADRCVSLGLDQSHLNMSA